MDQQLTPDVWRASVRASALTRAIKKRADGVPTFTVPEAAALLSVSQEYLYRLVRAGAFPAVQLRVGGGSGRYVIPARAIEKLLAEAADDVACVDSRAFSASWRLENSIGGA